jgi:hypothetical protein
MPNLALTKSRTRLQQKVVLENTNNNLFLTRVKELKSIQKSRLTTVNLCLLYY